MAQKLAETGTPGKLSFGYLPTITNLFELSRAVGGGDSGQKEMPRREMDGEAG